MTAIQTVSAGVFAAILGLLIIPSTSHAFLGAGGGGDSFFFGTPTYSSQPKQELYVRSFGPGSPSPAYTYTQTPTYPTYNQPSQYQNYGYQNYGYQNYSYGQNYNNYYTQPVNYAQTSYAPYNYAPYYDYGYQNYSYTPSYNSGYNSNPSYGYTYSNQVPGTDLWGNDLCYWGEGYNNLPCDRDPHQWVYDAYSGSWY